MLFIVPCVSVFTNLYYLLFIIFIYFFSQILEELIIYFSYCFISINNILLVIRYHLFLVVSGFQGNKFNLHFLFNWVWNLVSDIKGGT
jgi:hypothetical protein